MRNIFSFVSFFYVVWSKASNKNAFKFVVGYHFLNNFFVAIHFMAHFSKVSLSYVFFQFSYCWQYWRKHHTFSMKRHLLLMLIFMNCISYDWVLWFVDVKAAPNFASTMNFTCKLHLSGRCKLHLNGVLLHNVDYIWRISFICFRSI